MDKNASRVQAAKDYTHTVALRADMDALPVTEELELPFASKVRTTLNGEEAGVMPACGHDTHSHLDGGNLADHPNHGFCN